MSVLYDKYATILCKDIARDDLKTVVNIFLLEASIDMGYDLDKEPEVILLDRIMIFIIYDFKHLPLCMVASAFKKGALGQYGPGRLVPRTVYGWLSEMSQSYSLQKSHEHQQIDEKYKWDGLHKYPVGKAIIKKIEWLISGAITLDDWDKIPIKELSQILNKGMTCSPETFGIKYHSKNN